MTMVIKDGQLKISQGTLQKGRLRFTSLEQKDDSNVTIWQYMIALYKFVMQEAQKNSIYDWKR